MMMTPMMALAWDIWLRKRDSILWALALTGVACCFNFIVGAIASLEQMKSVVMLTNVHLFMGTLLLLLSVFGMAIRFGGIAAPLLMENFSLMS